MLVMDGFTVSLNHTAVNIGDEWTPQYERKIIFTINETGIFKVAFLLFTNDSSTFIPGA